MVDAVDKKAHLHFTHARQYRMLYLNQF